MARIVSEGHCGIHPRLGLRVRPHRYDFPDPNLLVATLAARNSLSRVDALSM
ncbi:hypothetical protein [Halovulum marinum]|uniref:hypothetical protein n=1 Tax=Halovulum marinum TaxID=2662447 RepID=UPI0012B1B574|nr:hypothetical protein [Halovulum marinum]